MPCPTCNGQGHESCCDAAGSVQPVPLDRQAELLGVLRVVAERLHGHVAEHWLMGESHPKGMTLGEYLRTAIDAGHGILQAKRSI